MGPTAVAEISRDSSVNLPVKKKNYDSRSRFAQIQPAAYQWGDWVGTVQGDPNAGITEFQLSSMSHDRNRSSVLCVNVFV